MNNKKITYNEIKSKQRKDISKKKIRYAFHRHFSNPFTYMFIKLGISPNTITILTFFISILGFIFLSKGTYISILIGMILFNLFHVFDCSDGEVARLQNKKSIEGYYLDELSHYVYSCSLGIGLGYGLYRLYHSQIYLYLGFVLALAFVLEYTIIYSLQSLVRMNIIDKRIRIKASDDEIQKRLINYIYSGKSWALNNIVSKLLGIYPFQGLVFSVYFILPIVMLLALIEYFLGASFGFPIIIYNKKFGILSFYLLMLAASKIVWVTGFISRIVMNRYITKFLNDLNHKS